VTVVKPRSPSGPGPQAAAAGGDAALATGRAAARSRARSGLLYAGSAFFIWGIVPVYFARLRAVSALEIIAHRLVWSTVFLAGLLALTRGFRELRVVLARPRTLAMLALTAALVGINWLTFVWSVNAGRLLDASLGYFITPQVNVLLGFLFLGERLRRTQWVALLLAAAGVLNQVWQLGQLPWIALVLALSFGSYGLFRKRIPVDPITGLLVETALGTPLALAYLVYLARAGSLQFGRLGWQMDAMLMFLGVVTAVPLMLFTAGAQRLRLVTIGFLQYLPPSMTFVLASAVYGEPLGRARVLTFVFIWAGILLYAADNLRLRAGQPPTPAPP
jgi:chloramphenicol-sensitive protein RarD